MVEGTAGVERRLQRLSTCSWKLFNDEKEDADTEPDRDSAQGGSWTGAAAAPSRSFVRFFGPNVSVP